MAAVEADSHTALPVTVLRFVYAESMEVASRRKRCVDFSCLLFWFRFVDTGARILTVHCAAYILRDQTVNNKYFAHAPG